MEAHLEAKKLKLITPGIMVIDPATHTPEIDCFNLLSGFTPHKPTFYHLPALLGFESITKVPFETIDRVIVLGSSCSPNDTTPWMSQLEKYLSKVIEKRIPLLAICFGHQLIAKMFGGRVEFLHANRDKELGWRTVDFNQMGTLKVNPRQGKLFCAHREVARDSPKELKLWATSSSINADEAYAHTEAPLWSLQAHPEATRLFLNNQSVSSLPDSNAFYFGHQLLKKFLIVSSVNQSPNL